MALRQRLLSVAVIALAAGGAACTAVLGDFSSAVVGGQDAGPQSFDGNVPPGPTPPPPPPGGGDAQPPDDAGFDAGVDSAIPLGPPGRPGQSLTGGGAFATSTNFKAWVALGESPGGNITATSTSYKLQSGVIGATQ